MAAGSTDEGKTELEVCDCHMHCWDKEEKVSRFNNHILGECGSYLPSDYRADLQYTPGALKLRSCVHVEAFTTDQVQETKWIASLQSARFPVGAIVANANLSLEKENDKSTSMQAEGIEALEDVLSRHKATSGLLRGIRWVLNHEPNWPQVYRGDYFQSTKFREGYQKLEEHGLSYDLQCNPHQLLDAANFMKDFPNVPVALNHIGCLKLEGDLQTDKDWRKSGPAQTWLTGMQACAKLPFVFCKLSMLQYTLGDWWTSDVRREIAKDVVRETINIFGPDRCMFASNFPAETPPGRTQLYESFKWMVQDMSAAEQEGLFFRNAERFYKIDQNFAGTCGPVCLLVGCYTKGHEPLGYYTNTADEGAYVVELNTQDGSLRILSGPTAAGVNPTYATFDHATSTAYFTNENLDKGVVKAFRLEDNKQLKELNTKAIGEGCIHPCFLGNSGGKVLCAHYVSGHVTVFPTAADGQLLDGATTALPRGTYPGPIEARQDGPHAHCFQPLGAEFGLVCDLGSDLMLCFRIADGKEMGRAKFPAGSGPRHVAVSASGRWAYVATELSNIIAACQVNPITGELGDPVATASLQPADYNGPATSASHIELSNCNRFAYVANRMGVPSDGSCANAVEGTISVIALDPKSTDQHLAFVETTGIGGKVPRSFCVVNQWLVVGAQETSFLKSFAIGADGKLTAAGTLEIPSPGVVIALDRNKRRKLA